MIPTCQAPSSRFAKDLAKIRALLRSIREPRRGYHARYWAYTCRGKRTVKAGKTLYKNYGPISTVIKCRSKAQIPLCSFTSNHCFSAQASKGSILYHKAMRCLLGERRYVMHAQSVSGTFGGCASVRGALLNCNLVQLPFRACKRPIPK